MYDIFANPKLKAVMVLYVVMMGFDLFGRIMIPDAPAAVATTSQNSESGVSGTQTEGGEIPAAEMTNGDAIPIDREGFEEAGRTTRRLLA